MRQDNLDASLSIYIKVGGFGALFILILIKNFFLERRIMRRFVEDYDPEIHVRFPFTLLLPAGSFN